MAPNSRFRKREIYSGADHATCAVLHFRIGTLFPPDSVFTDIELVMLLSIQPKAYLCNFSSMRRLEGFSS